MRHWEAHPHVRTGAQLTIGERAADRLKAAFGSWAFLIILNAVCLLWAALNLVAWVRHWDPYPFILLNLLFSWLAAQQGGALQIAANRGDRIASEVAMGTHQSVEQLLQINEQQLTILTELRALRAAVEDHGDIGSEAK